MFFVGFLSAYVFIQYKSALSDNGEYVYFEEDRGNDCTWSKGKIGGSTLTTGTTDVVKISKDKSSLDTYLKKAASSNLCTVYVSSYGHINPDGPDFVEKIILRD